jgi:hypothetical protein
LPLSKDFEYPFEYKEEFSVLPDSSVRDRVDKTKKGTRPHQWAEYFVECFAYSKNGAE